MSKNKKNIFNRWKNFPIILAIIFSISYLFIFSMQTGAVGRLIRYFYFLSFGVFTYIVPFYLAVLLLIFKYKKKEDILRKHIFYLGIILLLFMATYTIEKPLKELSHSIQIAKNLAPLNQGPGVLPSILAFILGSLFGKTGVYFLFGLSLLIYFLFAFKKHPFTLIKDIIYGLKKLFNFFKNKYNKIKEKFKRKKEDKIIMNIKNKLEKTEIDEGLAEIKNTEELKKEITIKSKSKKFDSESISIIDYNDSKDELIEQIKIDLIEEDEIGTENYKLPTTNLLNPIPKVLNNEKKEIIKKAEIIEMTLNNFGINAKVNQVYRGPSVTRFEIQPAPGVKVSRIVNLSDDLALSLAAQDIRILAPLPGKAAVGLEVPNEVKDMVSLREILETKDFKDSDFKLPIALGKSVEGKPKISSIDKMPHLLIAGATGSGKSVCINSIITSILYSAKPDEVKLILIDPKVVELSVYNGIPHLIIPVVTDPRKAASALRWAVDEMENRYKIFSENKVRDIDSYLEKSKDEELTPLPYIVIIIDELADLMMVAASEVESYISRLAQMARACGIHLIIATQRPSVDVITGTIKANIPSRISFQVSSQIDSRTILDMAGAEKLLGKGDMLFFPAGFSKPVRIQGAFINNDEVENVVKAIKTEKFQQYDAEILENIEEKTEAVISQEDVDPRLAEALDEFLQADQASVSLLQRRMRVGYARAGRMIDDLEEMGAIGPHEGSKPRKLLVTHNILRESKDESSE